MMFSNVKEFFHYYCINRRLLYFKENILFLFIIGPEESEKFWEEQCDKPGSSLLRAYTLWITAWKDSKKTTEMPKKLRTVRA